MAIQAEASGNYEVVPTGIHNAVLAQVVDLGLVPNRFYDVNQPGSRPTNRQVVYVFQLEGKKTDGTRFLKEYWFNLSAHEKSNIAKFLTGWEGKALTPEELQVDHETLAGKAAQLIVSVNKNNKNIITSAVPADPNRSLTVEAYDMAEYEKQLRERVLKQEDKFMSKQQQNAAATAPGFQMPTPQPAAAPAVARDQEPSDKIPF